MITLSLPFPPSGHKLFKRHNGSHLSAEYRAWRDEAGWALRAGGLPTFRGPVELTIELVNPNRVRRDCTNYTKAVEDLLVTHKVIEADDFRIVKAVTARWLDAGEPCRVTIKSVE